MTRPCDRCATPYMAKHPSSRFCSAACRTAAAKARKDGRPEAAAVPIHGVPDVSDGPITRATRSDLIASDRLDTMLGQACVALAGRVDAGNETGSAIAALVRELRSTMADAIRGAKRADDPVDELKFRRERRRTSA